MCIRDRECIEEVYAFNPSTEFHVELVGTKHDLWAELGANLDDRVTLDQARQAAAQIGAGSLTLTSSKTGYGVLQADCISTPDEPHTLVQVLTARGRETPQPWSGAGSRRAAGAEPGYRLGEFSHHRRTRLLELVGTGGNQLEMGYRGCLKLVREIEDEELDMEHVAEQPKVVSVPSNHKRAFVGGRDKWTKPVQSGENTPSGQRQTEVFLHQLGYGFLGVLASKDFSEIRAMSVGEMENPVSYTHLRAHETPEHLVCRLLLEKKKKNRTQDKQ
eukprot:TRINITY_DN7814_c0_g1_i1.p1 TRINITY_DN7814_c0_g1~~TRINITY_DN7814_c0_g1_i1.p1  ORF type:complete len:274 (-),score=71.07 TRINITY_DN7814_c0_g1_i1:76-897(-)